MTLLDELEALGPLGLIVFVLFVTVFSYKLWRADRGEATSTSDKIKQSLEEHKAIELSERLRAERANGKEPY